MKRMIDITMASLGIALFCPVMLFIAALIAASSRGPIIYRGKRCGLNYEDFYILKFRTMVDNAENVGGFSTARNDPRLTAVGKYLRRCKLDELPQLFNVLVGDMSLVGPRPQVRYYTDKYSEKEKKILSVRPGITDLASLYYSDMDSTLGDGAVDQRYECEVEPHKNELRLRYVEEMSLFLDFRILVETICSLFGFKNVTGLNVAQ